MKIPLAVIGSIILLGCGRNNQHWPPNIGDRVVCRYPDANGPRVITVVTKMERRTDYEGGICVSAVGYTNLALFWFEPIK